MKRIQLFKAVWTHVLAALVCGISSVEASQPACEATFSFSTSRIPTILIAPDHPGYVVVLKDSEGAPIMGATIIVTFPACFAGSVDPEHAPGAWSGSDYVASAAYEFADTTDVSGVAIFDWTESTGAKPSGGCIPVDLMGPNGSCEASLGCNAATVEVIWDDDGTITCGMVERSIVTPDIASGGRMCDTTPWEGSGTSSEVGLEDGVEFTPTLAGGSYQMCVDMNGDGRVNVFDAVIVGRYLTSAASVTRSDMAEPFYGDSLHLPVGVGDSETVIEHALTLPHVQLALGMADSAEYVRNAEYDKVESVVSPNGIPSTIAMMGFDVPVSMELPDSVDAIGTITVVTTAADTLETVVLFSTHFVDTRVGEVVYSQPGMDGIASLYEVPTLYGGTRGSDPPGSNPWGCGVNPGCLILMSSLAKYGDCVTRELTSWTGLQQTLIGCVVLRGGPGGCMANIAFNAAYVAVGCAMRVADGSE